MTFSFLDHMYIRYPDVADRQILLEKLHQVCLKQIYFSYVRESSSRHTTNHAEHRNDCTIRQADDELIQK